MPSLPQLPADLNPLPAHQIPPQPLDLVTKKIPANRHVVHEGVEAVERAIDHHQLTSNAAPLQPVGIGDVLLIEQIERADADPRRRQPGQVFAPTRNGIGRRLGLAGRG